MPALTPYPSPGLLLANAGFMRPAPRRAGLLAIAGLHGLLIWALCQGDAIRVVLRQAQPLMVALVHDAAPPPAPDLQRPRTSTPPPLTSALPPPEVTLANTPPAPVAVMVPVTPVALPSPPAPVTVVAEPTPVRMPAPVAAPPAPRQLSASAIRYRVPPPIEVPMASRRLGESGTVLLRVLVDALGQPRQITLHRSSGHARLDEQALAAMRQARFQPVSEDGAAIEWLVIAPLQYDVD